MRRGNRSKGRRNKKGKAKGTRAPKRGTPFEKVVAEIAREMNQGATVEQGVWVVGPDGRRELDVTITTPMPNRTDRILVECKDFNPASTGPVGIEYIDAIDSKRRDLAYDAAILCCNAGFTADALRKAVRLGIGAIGVLKTGDKRVRFLVHDEMYMRRITLKSLSLWLDGPDNVPVPLSGVPIESVLFEGQSVDEWMHRRATWQIGNPEIAQSFAEIVVFREPILFELPGRRRVPVERLYYEVRVEGSWFSQVVAFDGRSGVYDWIRRRVRLTAKESELRLLGLDLAEWQPLRCPPGQGVKQLSDRRPGELGLVLVHVIGDREPIADCIGLMRHAGDCYIQLLIPRPSEAGQA